MVYRIYTDASYSQQLQTAAVGFLILKQHEPYRHITNVIFKVKSSSDAERKAILIALKYILPVLIGHEDQVIIRTDQLCLVQKISDYNKNPNIRPSKQVMTIINMINIIKGLNVKVGIKYIKSHNKEERKSHHGYHDVVDRKCKGVLKNFKNKNNLKQS